MMAAVDALQHNLPSHQFYFTLMISCKLQCCCLYFPKGQKGNEDGGGWSRAVQRVLFINVRRAGCPGWCGGKCSRLCRDSVWKG